MSKATFIAFLMTVLSPVLMAADYPIPSYPEQVTCTIDVSVDLTKKFPTKKLALEHCNYVAGIFGNGCQVTRTSYDFVASFTRSWSFIGKGYDYREASSDALFSYVEFVDKFGWGRSFSHTLSYSACGQVY